MAQNNETQPWRKRTPGERIWLIATIVCLLLGIIFYASDERKNWFEIIGLLSFSIFWFRELIIARKGKK